jgi:hypothetical protein
MVSDFAATPPADVDKASSAVTASHATMLPLNFAAFIHFLSAPS